MTKLTEIEINQRIARAANAAKVEAKTAWAESWREPRKTNVCARLNRHENYLNKRGASSSSAGEIDAVMAEFSAVTEQQVEAILAEARAMAEDYAQGHILAKNLTLRNLEKRLGAWRDMLVRMGGNRRQKFYQARVECLKIFGNVERLSKKKTMAQPAPVVAVPERRFCKCCNSYIQGKRTINGYLPECWAEAERWRLIDEGKLSRAA